MSVCKNIDWRVLPSQQVTKVEDGHYVIKVGEVSNSLKAVETQVWKSKPMSVFTITMAESSRTLGYRVVLEDDGNDIVDGVSWIGSFRSKDTKPSGVRAVYCDKHVRVLLFGTKDCLLVVRTYKEEDLLDEEAAYVEKKARKQKKKQ